MVAVWVRRRRRWGGGTVHPTGVAAPSDQLRQLAQPPNPARSSRRALSLCASWDSVWCVVTRAHCMVMPWMIVVQSVPTRPHGRFRLGRRQRRWLRRGWSRRLDGPREHSREHSRDRHHERRRHERRPHERWRVHGRRLLRHRHHRLDLLCYVGGTRTSTWCQVPARCCDTQRKLIVVVR
eukprot:COSAG01_NODE_96_length_26789_cov_36.697089_18_plen_180_part_00